MIDRHSFRLLSKLSPFKLISPELCFNKPSIIFIRVVLPDPDGPVIPID